MKKLELTVTKQNNLDVVRYDLGAADVYDDRVSDKVSQMNNIIPFQYSDEDGKRSITSYVKDVIPLEIMLKKILGKKEVLSIVSGLASAFEIGAQGVPVSYIVKDANHIYVNGITLAVKCIVVPIKQDVMPMAELPVIFRNVISRMKFDDKDKDNYVARMLTLINADDFSVSKLKEIANSELEKMGLFISKDNGLLDMSNGNPQRTKDVKVNKLGVMNNMMGSRPPMGQPSMMGGQPGPMGQPPMMGGQPGPMGQAPMMGGQPGPMGQPPMMGGRPPMGQAPMMGGRPPMGQAPMMGGCPPMGQPPMMGGCPPMGQAPMMGDKPAVGTVPPQAPNMPKPTPMPMPGQAPMMGDKPAVGTVPPQAPNMPKPTPMPMPGQAPMMGDKPAVGTVPPQAPNMPKPTPMPVPGQAPMMGDKPPVGTVPPQAPNMTKPTPMPMPGQAPMMGDKPAVGTVPPQAANMSKPTPMPMPMPGQMMGGLVGQLGSKPVPHIVRKSTGESINISKSEFSIGKSKTKSDYAIENNPAISRVHCIIVQKDGVNYIKDNNSTNHTYVNGVELEPGKEVLLKNKTVIQLGDEEFTFLLRRGE